MSAGIVQPPDLEEWLTGYLRTTLREHPSLHGIQVEVGNKEPKDYQSDGRVLIVVRDDSGARLDAVTYDRSIGVKVYAGTRTKDGKANELSKLVFGILTTQSINQAVYEVIDSETKQKTGQKKYSPICSVEWSGCNGPYAVDPNDHDVAVRYMTVEYTVVGSWN